MDSKIWEMGELLKMSIESLGLWNRNYHIQEGGRIWDAKESGANVLLNSSYPEYTSAKYLKHLLLCLLDLTEFNELSVRSADNRGELFKVWKTIDIDTMVHQFEAEVNWGVWIILSGRYDDVPSDLFELLKMLPSNGFAIHLDIDSGLLAALGPNTKGPRAGG